MRSYPLTPSPEEFAQVGAAAILLTYRLIFSAFPELVTRMPNRVATGFIFVVAGMMCIPKNQTIHRIAKQLGLASHDTYDGLQRHFHVGEQEIGAYATVGLRRRALGVAR